MTERPSPGEQLAGIAGLVLLLTMFLFAWYGLNLPQGAPSVNGFDAFDSYDDWFDILLVATSFGAMSLLLFGAGTERSRIPLSAVTTVLGGISTIVLLIYIISPPHVPSFGEAIPEIGMGRKFGVWLGLISLIALTVGAYMTMQEEGISFGGAADRLSDRRGGAGRQPPAQPQQTPPPPPPPQQQPPPPPPPPQQPPPGPPPGGPPPTA